MKIHLRLIEFGKDSFAHLLSLIDRTFGEQDNHLTKLGVGALRDEERHLQIGAQPTFHLLDLDLDTTRTDHIILSPQNAETAFGEFGDIVGDEALGTDQWGIDYQTIVFIETDLHRRERSVPFGDVGAI